MFTLAYLCIGSMVAAAACGGRSDLSEGSLPTPVSVATETTSGPASTAATNPSPSTTATATATTGPSAPTASSTTPDGTGPGAETPGPAAGAFHDLLSLVPNDPKYLAYISAVDYELAASIVGAPPPDADLDGWIDAMLFDGGGAALPPAAFGSSMVSVDEWRAEFGFAVTDASAAADVGQPPSTVQMFHVDVTPADIDAAVRADPVWGTDLVDAEVDGQPYYFWSGEGEVDITRVSPARPLGRGGVMAVHPTDRGASVMLTGQQAELEAALIAPAGSSLADDPAVSATLQLLAEHDVYKLLMTSDSVTAPQGSEDVALPPYQLVTSGATSLPDGTQRMVLVFVHADAAAATTSAATLAANLANGVTATTGEPWSALVHVVDVTSSGSLAVAVLDMVEPTATLWAGVIMRRDSLIWTTQG